MSCCAVSVVCVPLIVYRVEESRRTNASLYLDRPSAIRRTFVRISRPSNVVAPTIDPSAIAARDLFLQASERATVWEKRDRNRTERSVVISVLSVGRRNPSHHLSLIALES